MYITSVCVDITFELFQKCNIILLVKCILSMQIKWLLQMTPLWDNC